MAKILTFPEVCNRYNVNKLMQLIERGPDAYPGAAQIIKQNT